MKATLMGRLKKTGGEISSKKWTNEFLIFSWSKSIATVDWQEMLGCFLCKSFDFYENYLFFDSDLLHF